MQLILYPLLREESQKAMCRKKGRWGHKYTYTPRSTLIHRLMEQTGMSYEMVYKQLQKERNYVIQYPQYYP